MSKTKLEQAVKDILSAQTIEELQAVVGALDVADRNRLTRVIYQATEAIVNRVMGGK